MSLKKKMIRLAKKSHILIAFYNLLSLDKFLKTKRYNHYKNLDPEKYPYERARFFSSAKDTTLNLEDPKTFDEKIQWLIVYDSTPLKTLLADKYCVREWVAEKIGDKYLIPLLGVWSSFDEIDFGKLPNSFVLKANHGSGWNIIVRDKNTFDIANAKRKFDLWMKMNFAYHSALELHYKDIVPKIIAEEYLENNSGNLVDYKVHCFGGRAAYIQYIGGRANGEAKEGWFDRNWNLMDFGGGNYPQIDDEIQKPENLDLLLTLSETLAKPFSYVRVDFYVLNDGTFKFGEMTFTPAGGIHKWRSYSNKTSYEVDLELGKLIRLPYNK